MAQAAPVAEASSPNGEIKVTLGINGDGVVVWSATRKGKPLVSESRLGFLFTDAAKMERFFEFAAIPSNRDVIRQDEYGNFMVVLLTGTIAVDRVQPWGEQLRLAETRPGDILGEMSLLDSGIRFSACTTLTDCEIAVLSAEAMDDMMTKDPQLAASLIALLARKLSLRLRVVSARLSDNHK